MDFKVSVIVPLYKGERFIKACVDGLLAQTLPEVEVVVVDDCSPDGSLDLCRSLYGTNERVQILTQPKNMGPGAARNTGIRAARGEYVASADCDDAVIRTAYETMYNLAKEKDADVVHTIGLILPLDRRDPDNLYEVDEKDYLRIITDACYRVTEVTVLADDLQDRYEKWRQHAYHWNLGTKLVRRQFILDNGLCFGDIRLSEDMAFCFGCLFLAKTYVMLPDQYYIYRISNTSLSRRGYTPQFLKMAVQAAVRVCGIAHGLMDRCEFFRTHEEARRGVIDYMIWILETEFITPAFQGIGKEAILADGTLKQYMEEEMGPGADYAFYAFMEQHSQYPPTESSTSKLNLDFMIRNREKIEKAIREGRL